MFDAAVDSYVARSLQVLAGQAVFFLIVAGWAWYKRGRAHFISEAMMFSIAAMAFGFNKASDLQRPEWFALLSLVLWVHMALIVREVLTKGDAE